MKILNHELLQTDIVCNKCAMSCRDESSTITQPSYNGCQNAEVVGSYWSTHVNDGDVHQFDLCERCFLELSATFKRPSYVGNYLNPNHVRKGFDRASYFEEGKKLWENLSKDEQQTIKFNLFDNLEWVNEMPKEELIYYLYELEYEDVKEETPERHQAMIDKVKEVLALPKHKNYK